MYRYIDRDATYRYHYRLPHLLQTFLPQTNVERLRGRARVRCPSNSLPATFLTSCINRFKARLAKPYELPKVTLKEIHDAVPKELHKRNTLKGIYWALRDAALCYTFYKVWTFRGV